MPLVRCDHQHDRSAKLGRGRRPRLYPAGTFGTAKVLVVSQTYEGHRQIAKLLDEIRKVAQKTPSDEPPLRSRHGGPRMGMGGMMGGGMMGPGMGAARHGWTWAWVDPAWGCLGWVRPEWGCLARSGRASPASSRGRRSRTTRSATDHESGGTP